MYDNLNMQQNSINANLMLGKCDGNSILYNELLYQAIYSETDKSLTFVHTESLTLGDIYNDKVVTAVYTGFETTTYTNQSYVPWYSVRENIEIVTFDEIVKPKSTAYWFYGFNNLKDIDLKKLDTSNVTNMSYMFQRCSSLIKLDLSSFDTSKVSTMSGMFSECSSLSELDVRNFNTIKVTNMSYMFSNCLELSDLDLSNFDITLVANASYMFNNCYNLISEIKIMSNVVKNYTNILNGVATVEGASIAIYYVGDNISTDANESTETLVDAIIATKSTNSNVVKGCIGEYCSIET